MLKDISGGIVPTIDEDWDKPTEPPEPPKPPEKKRSMSARGLARLLVDSGKMPEDEVSPPVLKRALKLLQDEIAGSKKDIEDLHSENVPERFLMFAGEDLDQPWLGDDKETIREMLTRDARERVSSHPSAVKILEEVLAPILAQEEEAKKTAKEEKNTAKRIMEQKRQDAEKIKPEREIEAIGAKHHVVHKREDSPAGEGDK